MNEEQLRQEKIIRGKNELIFLLAFGVILLFVALVGAVCLIGGANANLKAQLDELSDEFQVYRSAAQDAYSFALRDECEYGEQIPNEFFIRYTQTEPLTQEESYAIYKEAQRIVSERLQTRGYNYRMMGRGRK